MESKERVEFKKLYHYILSLVIDCKPYQEQIEKYGFNQFVHQYATKEEFDYYHEMRRKNDLVHTDIEKFNCQFLDLKRNFDRFLDYDFQKGISFSTEKARIYYDNYCTYDEKIRYEQVERIFIKHEKTRKCFFQELARLDFDRDIEQFCLEYDQYISVARSNVWDYCASLKLSKDQPIQLESLLKEKLTILQDYRKKKNNQIQKERKNFFLSYQAKDAVSLISFFLESGLSRKKFCQNYGLTQSYFCQCLKLVSEYDFVLYNQYCDVIQERHHDLFHSLLKKSSLIVDRIQNGILQDDHATREFELLDYYFMTDIGLSDMAKIVSNLGTDASRVFRKFSAKYQKMMPLNLERELAGTLIIKDHVVSQQEKLEVIDYLKQHHIPLTTILYKQAVRRHIQGMLYSQDQKNSESSIQI